MNRYRAILTALALAAMTIFTTGCTEIVNSHGYAPTDADLEVIEVGLDTRQTVSTIIGQPGTTGILDDRGWYYVKSEFRTFAWREPEETGRQVVAILFDEEGVVENIERFGIEDGRVVALSRRVSDANTTGVSFLQQLFGNIGNFNPGQFLSDS